MAGVSLFIGPFYAPLIRSLLSDRNLQEWDKLAKWVVNNKLFSHNVRWLIQVPRLYEVYKGTGAISNFGEIVRS
jgi:adenosine deaminase